MTTLDRCDVCDQAVLCFKYVFHNNCVLHFSLSLEIRSGPGYRQESWILYVQDFFVSHLCFEQFLERLHSFYLSFSHDVSLNSWNFDVQYSSDAAEIKCLTEVMFTVFGNMRKQFLTLRIPSSFRLFFASGTFLLTVGSFFYCNICPASLWIQDNHGKTKT